jgi:hypothetical protein
MTTHAEAPAKRSRDAGFYVIVVVAVLAFYMLSMGPMWAFIDFAHPKWDKTQYLAIPYIPLMLAVEDTWAEDAMRTYISFWTRTPVGPLRVVRW